MFNFFKNLISASKTAGDLQTLHSTTEAEIAALEKQLGTKAPARPAFMGNRVMVAQAMLEHREQLKTMVSAPKDVPPVPPQAKAPVAPPAPVAAAITQIGKTVAKLATDPRASVSGPIIEGLGKSIEASQVVAPCFDFLTGFEKMSLKKEWQERGGLSEKSLRHFNYRRAEFCKANKITPEEAHGCPGAPLPQMVIESVGEKKARLEKATKVEQLRTEKMDVLNQAITTANGDKGKLEELAKAKAFWSEYYNREAQTHSAPAGR